MSISYYTIKDYCYISELALFPAYVRTGCVRTYAEIDLKRAIWGCRRKRQGNTAMVIPCLCLLLFEFCTAHHIPRPNGRATSFLVDIPSRWEPRTNKHPTGVFAVPPAAVPCCSSSVPSTTKKVPRPFGLGTRGGRYRTRTCDLLHVKQMLYQLS